MRVTAIHVPRAVPYARIASTAYSEQVGTYLHAGGKTGETARRYTCRMAITASERADIRVVRWSLQNVFIVSNWGPAGEEPGTNVQFFQLAYHFEAGSGRCARTRHKNHVHSREVTSHYKTPVRLSEKSLGPVATYCIPDLSARYHTQAVHRSARVKKEQNDIGRSI